MNLLPSQTTYLALNLGFGVVLVALLWRWVRGIEWRAYGVAAVALVALTLVFDNLIVAFGIVAYDPNKLLGIWVPVAPIEDFGYALLAAVAVPAVWQALGALDQKEDTDA